MSASMSPKLQTEGLRERNVPHGNESLSSGATSGQDTPVDKEDEEKDKKTFGRTTDGTSTLSSQTQYVQLFS
jgi:hypothetical protein